MPKPLETGDPRTLGRFELLARLGEGGQGIVYLGRGPGPGEERVAVKVLRSTADASVLERLARELDAIHHVQPFVTASVIEASTDGERRYIVSEFIDGPSLQERVDTRGPLPEGELQRLAVGTATALTAIHGAGVVHRDFKPANVLLGPDGPRVVDFGIARLIDAATMTSGIIGTPSYIAPEQLSGARPTSAVDIFAWAVTMFFAATGRPAFGGDTVMAVMHRIMTEQPDISGMPESMIPVVSDCLNKDPSRRPSARDLLLRLVDPSLANLRPVPDTGPLEPPAAGTAVRTGPVPSLAGSTASDYGPVAFTTGPVPAPRRSRRGPVLATAGAAVAVAVIVAAVLLLTRGSPHSGPPGAAGSTSAGTAGTSPAGQTSASASASAGAPAAGVAIPAAFAGTWTGTATMAALADPSLGLPNSITFTLATGRNRAGEVNDTCINTLTLTKASATKLTFSEPGTDLCVAGTVTFTLQGESMAYRWTDGIEQNTAMLHRKSKK
ncbi:MAG TPA: serine/threonine-protein kinase [Streptosporangiaceae bacterium]|nr:serine/threonine-protein kinase [Streptosporangiaceae bacterium]